MLGLFLSKRPELLHLAGHDLILTLLVKRLAVRCKQLFFVWSLKMFQGGFLSKRPELMPGYSKAECVFILTVYISEGAIVCFTVSSWTSVQDLNMLDFFPKRPDHLNCGLF